MTHAWAIPTDHLVVIDVAILVLVVLLVARGWMRGLVREAIDVGTLVLGWILESYYR